MPLSGCPVQIMCCRSDPAGEYDATLLANIELCLLVVSQCTSQLEAHCKDACPFLAYHVPGYTGPSEGSRARAGPFSWAATATSHYGVACPFCLQLAPGRLVLIAEVD